jgi:hypothetical protein
VRNSLLVEQGGAVNDREFQPGAEAADDIFDVVVDERRMPR